MVQLFRFFWAILISVSECDTSPLDSVDEILKCDLKWYPPLEKIIINYNMVITLGRDEMNPIIQMQPQKCCSFSVVSIWRLTTNCKTISLWRKRDWLILLSDLNPWRQYAAWFTHLMYLPLLSNFRIFARRCFVVVTALCLPRLDWTVDKIQTMSRQSFNNL